MIEVTEAKTDREIKEFIRFPFDLYKNDPFYSPELIKDQKEHFSPANPFFRNADVKFLLARAGGKTVGRVTSIVNQQHIRFHNEKAGFFGFFESRNDPAIANILLDTVSKDLGEAGMTVMRGPMDFSTNEQCGFLIEGFHEPPMLMTPYNPPYYPELMQQCGMTKAKDLLAFIVDVPEELPEKVLRVARLAERRGIKIRRVEKKRFSEELRAFKDVYNDAWNTNWGFIPLTDDDLEYLGKRLKPIAPPEMTLIAEKDGDPVGFLGLLPDFNLLLRKMKGRLNAISILKALYYQRTITDLRLLLLGVKSAYRHRGVDALMFREAFKAARKRHKRVEMSWILEDNEPVIRIIEMFGSSLYKKYRIYEKTI
ncbi:MAG: hypothetical protein IEMM0007_1820 [bacterium]|nr:MAG: hypothetical protein IEMM0007_1820 [bacterium]